MSGLTAVDQRRVINWAVGLLIVGCLLTLIALQGQHHFVTPPFENDFYGFSERAQSLSAALKLNGYYPLGYPLLLWLLGPLAGNAFAAAKVVAVAHAGILLLAGFWLSRMLLGRGWLALLGLVALALNPYFWQTALFLGTDLPWAAWQCLALGACVWAIQRGHDWRGFALAGALGGLAYLLRYTALALLPVVWLYLALAWLRRAQGARSRNALWAALAFTILFLAVALPQLYLSWRETGNPFFTSQAKNIWFGIYGEGDWQAHWGGVRSDISLWEVFTAGPWRLIGHWLRECGRWLAYSGVVIAGVNLTVFRQVALGGRVVLAILGSLLAGGIIWLAILKRGAWRELLRLPAAAWLLALYYLTYGLSVALVFVQPRFFIAILSVLLSAALVLLDRLGQRRRTFLVVILAAWGLLASANSAASLVYYLDKLQPPVAQVAASLQAAGVGETEAVWATSEMPYRYHTSFDFQSLPSEINSLAALQAEMRAQQVRFLLFEREYGLRYWPALGELLEGRAQDGFRLLWQQEGQAALYQLGGE
jgi:hypothetical protein